MRKIQGLVAIAVAASIVTDALAAAAHHCCNMSGFLICLCVPVVVVVVIADAGFVRQFAGHTMSLSLAVFVADD